jgi:hypothetical protein
MRLRALNAVLYTDCIHAVRLAIAVAKRRLVFGGTSFAQTDDPWPLAIE